MASSRRGTSGSSSSRSTRKSSDSRESTGMAPPSLKGPVAAAMARKLERQAEDVSPGTSLYPRSSVETYASTTASSEDLARRDVEMKDAFEYFDGANDESPGDDRIPPLRSYQHPVVEPDVRPARPDEFAALFPSMKRLSIRHDEFTPDGNMNLRVDALVQGRHRRQAIQLFHLRMYDLGRRDFSLRRYCRDSGREVCSSKRRYESDSGPETARGSAAERPAFQRAVTTAIKTLGSPARPGGFRRVASSGAGSIFGGSRARPGSSSSSSSGDGDDEHSQLHNHFQRSLSFQEARRAAQPKPKPVPTNTIKLEFSNYARVDVTRRGGRSSKRYEFDWWGHRYSWKRVAEKHLPGAVNVAFHLIRDGDASRPVAHIVPEARDPHQVAADEEAGGWIPPCYLWIADESVIDAVTDVADVIVATGLMALVDDCIKERWSRKKRPASSSSSSSTLHGIGAGGAVSSTASTLVRSDSSDSVSKKVSAVARNVFRRMPTYDAGQHRQTHNCNHGHNHHHQQTPTSPLRFISAY